LIMDFSSPGKLPSFLAAQLPALQASEAGKILYCSNAFLEGFPDLVVWIGTAWMRMSDQGTPGTSSNAANVVSRNSAPSTVVNTAAETPIFSYNMPAGLLGTDRTLQVQLMGDLLNNSGANQSITFRVAVGGVTVYGDFTGAIATSASRRPWNWILNFANLGAANQNYLSGTLMLGVAGNATTGLGDIGAAGFREVAVASAGALAFDTAAAQTIAVFAQLSAANAALDFRRFKAIATIL
jgi:hypothetical protein